MVEVDYERESKRICQRMRILDRIDVAEVETVNIVAYSGTECQEAAVAAGDTSAKYGPQAVSGCCIGPAGAYIPELIDDVIEGTVNPGLVFDFDTDLDGVGEAYAAMDERRAIKSLLRVSNI